MILPTGVRGIMKVVVFIVKQPSLLLKIYRHDSGHNNGGVKLCSHFVNPRRQLPSSLSDSLPEVKGLGEVTSSTITISLHLNIIGNIWDNVNTQLNKSICL